MGATLTVSPKPGIMPEKVLKSLRQVRGARKLTKEYNIDTMRAALKMVASNHGLTCDIEPIEQGSENTWVVLFDGYKVASIVETGTGKSALPKVCPSCGTDYSNSENKPRTNAHNVVSASIWRAVFTKVFSNWFGASETQIDEGKKDLMDSLERVASGTTRSSTMGAATQGDRRTCKACETLQGGLSLLQRHNIAKSVQDTHGKNKLTQDFYKFVGQNYGQSVEHPKGFRLDVHERITKERIEDVIRGIALEIRNRHKYMSVDPKDKKVKWKQKYQFMAIFDTDEYYKFLDDIRTEAFQMAAGKPLSDSEAQGLKAKLFTN